MNWQDYIHTDNAVMEGKPVFMGTRLTIEYVLQLQSEGWSEQRLLDELPSLTARHLQALHAFTYENLKDGLLIYPFRKAS